MAKNGSYGNNRFAPRIGNNRKHIRKTRIIRLRKLQRIARKEQRRSI